LDSSSSSSIVPSPVLLVTILNPLYPINVDVLSKIFNQYNRFYLYVIIIF
jgi:hypothetical protein